MNDSTIQDIFNGKTGIAVNQTYFDLGLNSGKVGSVKNFEPRNFNSTSAFLRLPASYQFALYVVDQVIKDAKLNLDQIDKRRIAIYYVTGLAGISSVEKFYYPVLTVGIEKGSPLRFPNTTSSVGGGLISIRYNFQGNNLVISSGGVSGMQAIDIAQMGLENDEFDIAIIVGADELTETVFKAYYYTKMIGHKNEHICIPYIDDSEKRKRNSTILGEGAAAIVIEKESHALERKASIKGYIRGVINLNNTYQEDGYTKHDYRDNISLISNCLDESRVKKSHINAIVGAGNGNITFDSCEAKALKEVFQKELPPVITPSIIFGETNGVSGLLNIICGALMLERNQLIKTLENYDSYKQYINVNYKDKRGGINNILVQSVSFYGDISSLVISNTKY